MSFDFSKLLAEDTEDNIHDLPRWARITIAAVLVIAVGVLIALTYENVRKRIMEKENANGMSAEIARQKGELDALHKAAVAAGNITRDPIALQKKNLDLAHKTVKGPKTTVSQQMAELNALRATALSKQK